MVINYLVEIIYIIQKNMYMLFNWVEFHFIVMGFLDIYNLFQGLHKGNNVDKHCYNVLF